jgi:hypothetical protein
MHLIQVHPADTSMGPGFEQHTFECVGCSDVEQRLTFNSPSAPRPAVATRVDDAPPTSSEQPDPDYALLKNAWEMLRGWRKL